MTVNEKDTLRRWAKDLGIEITMAQMDLFSIYLNELWSWNKKINLTGLHSVKMVIRELLLDSLMVAPFLPEAGRLLDIGSGAGFPAIPLKIHKPGLNIHLFEANRKKASFLKHAIRLMELSDIKVFQGRIEEDCSLLNKEGYNAITARAFAELPLTLKSSAPHLEKGGIIINFQGQDFEKALNESSRVMGQYKIKLDSTLHYRLPGKNTIRSLLVFRKA